MGVPDVEILLPVHNEGESIEATIREIYNEFSPRTNVGFIICEDGSKDNTKEALRRLANDLPLRLNLTDARRGYSRAVREGMHMLEADYLLCIDSDGQCDAKDFWKFWGRSQKVRCSPRLARGPRPPGPVQGRFGTNSKQSGYVAEGDAGHLGPLIHLRNAGDGGSINYFFEGLFGLAPVAAFAVLSLTRPDYSVASLLLSGLLVMNFSMSLGLTAFKDARSLSSTTSEENRKTRVLRTTFQDQKVLSFATTATFFAPEVIVSDPFLTSYLERLGRFDLRPLAARIRTQAFDLVVTESEPHSYRGINWVSPTLIPAIREAYEPFCRMEDLVMFVRRNNAGLVGERLAKLGCSAEVCPYCLDWRNRTF